MGAVLSQNEVDALLRGVSGDDMDMDDEEDEYDPEEVVPFDLTAQDRIIRGRMPTLEIIHDRFVRLFRLTLSNALRKVVDISVRSTELIKFGEFLKTLPVPSSMNLFRMTPLRGNAILVLETRLVFTLIDLFFGGNGELEIKSEGRDFTEIEGPGILSQGERVLVLAKSVAVLATSTSARWDLENPREVTADSRQLVPISAAAWTLFWTFTRRTTATSIHRLSGAWQ
jgi:flagellar motor switch protein FliM